MRLISIEKLRVGDVLGQDIVDHNGAILLRRSTLFKEAYREKLKQRYIRDVYIEDSVSEGINPQDILSQHARHEITEDIKNQFNKVQTYLSVDLEVVTKVSDILMEELLSKDIVCEMKDLKTNHDDTYEHCIGVAIMAAIVCKQLHLERDMTQKVVMGAILHDIGKMIIPKDILDKPAALTKEEYAIVKTHAAIGYEMIKENPDISPITKVAILCHHEREDGRGYPLGKGEDLHIAAKIIAVCDVFHALLSDRSYRKGLPVNQAILVAKGENLCPEIRQIVEGILAFYPVGCVVRLNTGHIGIVERNYTNDLQRPLVRVVYHLETESREQYRLDLQMEEKMWVTHKLDDLPYDI
ncbi:MAG: HD-GYP domain-containing protein [Cellulosilyticaceae bacterium]